MPYTKYKMYEDRSVVVFTLLPGQSVFCVYSIAQDNVVDSAVHVVVCKTDPGPDPPKPNTWKAWTIENAKSLVPKDRLPLGLKLSAAMEGVLASINAGALTDTEQARSAVRAANRVVCYGDDRKAWLPFFSLLDEQMDAFAEKGELKTIGQYKEIWTGVSEGLKEVGK